MTQLKILNLRYAIHKLNYEIFMSIYKFSYKHKESNLFWLATCVNMQKKLENNLDTREKILDEKENLLDLME